jgi:hypothetical protein
MLVTLAITANGRTRRYPVPWSNDGTIDADRVESIAVAVPLLASVFVTVDDHDAGVIYRHAVQEWRGVAYKGRKGPWESFTVRTLAIGVEAILEPLRSDPTHINPETEPVHCPQCRREFPSLAAYDAHHVGCDRERRRREDTEWYGKLGQLNPTPEGQSR